MQEIIIEVLVYFLIGAITVLLGWLLEFKMDSLDIILILIFWPLVFLIIIAGIFIEMRNYLLDTMKEYWDKWSNIMYTYNGTSTTTKYEVPLYDFGKKPSNKPRMSKEELTNLKSKLMREANSENVLHSIRMDLYYQLLVLFPNDKIHFCKDFDNKLISESDDEFSYCNCKK